MDSEKPNGTQMAPIKISVWKQNQKMCRKGKYL